MEVGGCLGIGVGTSRRAGDDERVEKHLPIRYAMLTDIKNRLKRVGFVEGNAAGKK